MSGITATASQVAERYGVPYVNAESSSPGLTERGFKWFFRTSPHDGPFSAHRAKTTNLDAEVGKVEVFHAAHRIVGLGLSHVFERRRLFAYLRDLVRPTVGTAPQWPRADCR